MILLDILNINNNDFIENEELSIKFINNYNDINHDEINNILDTNILKDDILKKKIKIIKILGEGSYGIVYKIKIDSKYYAFKLNKNEIPDKLNDRYNSLLNCESLRKYIIDIYIAGKLLFNDNFIYFSIMEYGGDTLRNIYDKFDLFKLKLIMKQLFNIIHITSKNKFLMTDFKLSNITCNSNLKIKLIDIYMFCETYTPCVKCKIVRTYSTIELEQEKRIYEDPAYNYTCIYIPFAICIIDLICNHTMHDYSKKISDKFNLNMNIKQIIPLLQISCYNFNNKSNSSIKSYKNLYKYKKYTEDEYPIIKNDDFYKYFVSLIDIKHDFISKKKFILILNDLINLDPNQRSLKYLKHKLIE